MAVNLPDEVHEFEIRRIPEIDFVEVSAPEAAWIPGLKRADLTRAAERKERKLSAYRERADEVWLLIPVTAPFGDDRSEAR